MFFSIWGGYPPPQGNPTPFRIFEIVHLWTQHSCNGVFRLLRSIPLAILWSLPLTAGLVTIAYFYFTYQHSWALQKVLDLNFPKPTWSLAQNMSAYKFWVHWLIFHYISSCQKDPFYMRLSGETYRTRASTKHRHIQPFPNRLRAKLMKGFFNDGQTFKQ